MRPFRQTLALACLLGVSCTWSIDFAGRLTLPGDLQSRFSPQQRGVLVIEVQLLNDAQAFAQYRIATLCGASASDLTLPLTWSEETCLDDASASASIRAFVAPAPEGDTHGCNDAAMERLTDEQVEALRGHAIAVGSQDVTLSSSGLRLYRCEGGSFAWDFALSPLVAP